MPRSKKRGRDERYRRAVGRQQVLNDRGYYMDVDGRRHDPVPAEQLMREEERCYNTPPDYREWAHG